MKIGDKILITEAGMKYWFNGDYEKPAYGILACIERYENYEGKWVEENYFKLYDSSGILMYKYWYLREDEFILVSKKEPEEWM